MAQSAVPEAVSLRALRRRFGPLLQNWRRSAKAADTSYAGEFTHLESLAAKIQIQHGYVVDIAASDGVSQSSTLGFFCKRGWKGLAVEMDPDKFSTLAFIYAQFKDARLARCRVTPRNVRALLEGYEVPHDFALLNLDIDSYDLYVLEAMLQGGFRPQIISMEINEKIPPPLIFSVVFDETHHWQGDHFYGCSLTAAVNCVRPHSYRLESLQFNNAVFVRADVAAGVIEDRSDVEAYDSGYRHKPGRQQLFPWNSAMDCVLSYPPDQAIAFFNELFREYRGKFILGL